MTSFDRCIKEERGNIVLLGLVGGSAALYWTWQLINTVRDAVLRRENAGTISDAVAAESAYWHAQGMNLLAFINILMAIILSLFVAVRIAQLIAVTVAIIATIFGGGPVAAAAGRFAQSMYQTEQKITPPILRTLTFATQAERAIAAVFPWVATAASASPGVGSTGAQAYPVSGVALSPSLFPTFADRRLARPGKELFTQSVKTFPARMGGLLDTNKNGAIGKLSAKLTTKVGGKFPLGAIDALGSLPVEEEDYQQVCKRASMNWGSFGFLDGLPWIETALGWLGGNLPGLMCEPMNQAQAMNKVKQKLTEEAKNGANDHCADSETKERDALRQQGKPDVAWDATKREKCRKDKRKELEREGRKKADSIAKSQPNTENIKTARLWFFVTPTDNPDPRYAGRLSIDSPWLHTWSMVWDKQDHSSKAIYYAQCAAIEPNTAPWTSENTHCAENAMWRLQWRYMLGLNHTFATEMRHLGIDAVRGYLGFLEGQVLSRGLGGVFEKLGIKYGGRGDSWGQRLVTVLLQGKNGKLNYTSWSDPATVWTGSYWESLYH